MKGIIYLLLAAAIIAVIYFAINQNKGESGSKGASDYEKIETVRKAMEELSQTAEAKTVSSDQGQWYIFDLRVLKDKTEPFYVKLREKLGKDFDSKLSNGDYLFAGIYPLRGSYRVYAGDPASKDSMLYPDWNYTKLEKKQ